MVVLEKRPIWRQEVDNSGNFKNRQCSDHHYTGKGHFLLASSRHQALKTAKWLRGSFTIVSMGF